MQLDENHRFDKFAGRPLTHIRVLRGTCPSMGNANLDGRRAAPPIGRRPIGGAKYRMYFAIQPAQPYKWTLAETAQHVLSA